MNINLFIYILQIISSYKIVKFTYMRFDPLKVNSIFINSNAMNIKNKKLIIDSNDLRNNLTRAI